jgi:hypothetical protein
MFRDPETVRPLEPVICSAGENLGFWRSLLAQAEQWPRAIAPVCEFAARYFDAALLGETELFLPFVRAAVARVRFLTDRAAVSVIDLLGKYARICPILAHEGSISELFAAIRDARGTIWTHSLRSCLLAAEFDVLPLIEICLYGLQLHSPNFAELLADLDWRRAGVQPLFGDIVVAAGRHARGSALGFMAKILRAVDPVKYAPVVVKYARREISAVQEGIKILQDVPQLPESVFAQLEKAVEIEILDWQCTANWPLRQNAVGLRNHGQTCYVNSVLQLLFALPGLVRGDRIERAEALGEP